VFCQLAEPLKLWEKYKDSRSEDVKRQLVNDYQEIDIETIVDFVHNNCLVLLEQVVFSMGNHSFHQFGLPSPSHDASELIVNRDYCEVIKSVDSDSRRVFFLDDLGGNGKTFLMNLLLARVRLHQK